MKKKLKKKEVFERQEFPVKSGRFKGLGEAEYKAEIRKLRKMKADRDKSLEKPKLSKKKLARKSKAIASKTQAIKNAFEMAKEGKVRDKRAAKDINRKSKAINRKISKLNRKSRKLKRPKLSMGKPKKSMLGKALGMAALVGVGFGLSKLISKNSKK
jgi:hypothetical protein